MDFVEGVRDFRVVGDPSTGHSWMSDMAQKAASGKADW